MQISLWVISESLLALHVCACPFDASLRPLCAIKAGVSKCDSALMDNDKVADELPQPFPSPVGARRSTVWCRFNPTRPWKISIKVFPIIRLPFEIAHCARARSRESARRVGGWGRVHHHPLPSSLWKQYLDVLIPTATIRKRLLGIPSLSVHHFLPTPSLSYCVLQEIWLGAGECSGWLCVCLRLETACCPVAPLHLSYINLAVLLLPATCRHPDALLFDATLSGW